MGKLIDCFEKLRVPSEIQSEIRSYIKRGVDEKQAVDLYIDEVQSGIEEVRQKLIMKGYNVRNRTIAKAKEAKKPNSPNILDDAILKSESAMEAGGDYKGQISDGDFPVKESGDIIRIGTGPNDKIKITSKPVSVRQARKELADISPKLNWYGTNVVVRGGTGGIFSRNGEYIQTAQKDSSQAAEVLPHELFHWIDETKAYGTKLRNFSNVMADSYTYDVNAPISENGAEFFRHYMTDAQALIDEAPESVKELERILKTNPKMYMKIKKLQKTLHNYFHQPIALRAKSKNVPESSFMRRMYENGMGGNWRELVRQQRRVRQSLFDGSRGMLDVAQSTGNQDAYMKIISLADNVHGVTQRIMQNGVPKDSEGAFVFNTDKTNGITDIFDQFDKEGREKLGAHIDATRSARLIEEGKERLADKDTIELGLSYGNDPKIAKAAADFHKFMDDLLDFVVANGGVSADVVKDFKGDWVSFARHMEFSETDKANFSDPLKAIVGGSQSLKDFETRVSSSILNLTAMAIKGRIKRSLYPMVDAKHFIPWDVAEAAEDIDFKSIAEKLAKANDNALPDKIMVKNSKGEMVPDIEKLTEYLKENPWLVADKINELPTHPEYVIDPWIDKEGNTQYVAMPKGEALAESMNSIGVTNRTLAGKVWAHPKNILSRVLIMSRPKVAIPLVIMDRLIHPISSMAYGYNVPKAYYDGAVMLGKSLINHKSLKDYYKTTAISKESGGYFEDTFNRAPKIGDKERGNFTFNAVMQRMESISKILEYKQSKKRGMSEAKAQANAELMTARWRKHGTGIVASTATDIIPFLKAYSNSFASELDSMFRSTDDITKYSPKRFAEVMAKGTFTIGAATAAMYAWFISDDERRKFWDESTPEDRMRNIQYLVMGDADFSTMTAAQKVPFFFGSLFAGSVIMAMDKWRGVDRDGLVKEFVSRIGETAKPPGSIAVIDNFLYLWANKDPWSGRPIENAYMKNRVKSERSRISTPEFITDNATDEDVFSPIQQDFLAKRMFGSWGKAVYDIAVAETWKDEEYGQQPFVKYDKDNSATSLLSTIISPSKTKSKLIYNTVYSERFLDMYKSYMEVKSSAAKKVSDAKKKGTMSEEDWYMEDFNRRVKGKIDNYYSNYFEESLKGLTQEQKIVQGAALGGLTYDTMTRVKYGNTKEYKGAYKNEGLLTDVLKKYGGKTVNTGFGKVEIPRNYYRYKKKAKDGGTKEAVMFALNRYKLDRLKQIVISAKPKEANK